MLDLVKGESERTDSRFLELACGSGNFLVPVLRRKLATVHERFAKIDLGRGWAGAQASVTDGITDHRGLACFDTEAELDRYISNQPQQNMTLASASCTSSIRLYAGRSFGTSVLAISVRLSWQNLSPAGFDNTTRPYQISSCATTFATNSGGGGSHLSAGAGTHRSTMPSGWDRTISSVYLAETSRHAFGCRGGHR